MSRCSDNVNNSDYEWRTASGYSDILRRMYRLVSHPIARFQPEKQISMTEKKLFVGIDLGTIKTCAVASNGLRHTVPTCVGWARDMVARKVVGANVAFGDDICRHRRALNIIRPFFKGALKFTDQKSAGINDDDLQRYSSAIRLLLHHVVEQLQPSQDCQIHGILGVPSRASAINQKFILEAAKQEFDSLMLVHEPFAVAYGMNRLEKSLVVDIGAGTIDICPMYGAYSTAEDQWTIPLGGDLIDEQIVASISKQYPEARVSLDLARQIKQKFATVNKRSEAAIVTLATDGKPQEFDLTNILYESCLSLVQPIVEGIWRVVSKFEPEYQRFLLNNILLAGGGSQLPGLDIAIEREIEKFGGGHVYKAHDTIYAGAAGALKLAMEMPQEEWNRIACTAKNAA